jgi:hypothetical protein
MVEVLVFCDRAWSVLRRRLKAALSLVKSWRGRTVARFSTSYLNGNMLPLGMLPGKAQCQLVRPGAVVALCCIKADMNIHRYAESDGSNFDEDEHDSDAEAPRKFRCSILIWHDLV